MAGNPCAKPRGELGGEEFVKRVLLLSEGGADCEFLRKLVDVRGLNECQVVRPADGNDFRERLRSIRSIADPGSTVVIVTDSDDDPADTLKGMQAQLREVGDYGVPTALGQPATSPDLPTLVVITLPRSDTPGNLESLLLGPLSTTYPQERGAVDQLLNPKVVGWSPGKQAKARVACMIATICQDDPSCSVSTMWYGDRGFQPLLSDNGFNDLVDFFRNL